MSAAAADSGREHDKVPRRVIHCSDGVVEEFSTDEDDDDQVDAANAEPHVDPVILTSLIANTEPHSCYNTKLMLLILNHKLMQ